MLKFLSGPAAGLADGLMVRRAPLYLRVVRHEDGRWDALDMPVDTVEPGETAFAYRLVGKPRPLHVRSSERGASGSFWMAEYEWVEPRPSADTMADNGLWRAWCFAKQAEEKE